MKKSLFAVCAVMALHTFAPLHAVTQQAAIDAAIVPGAGYYGSGVDTSQSAFSKQLEAIGNKYMDDMGKIKDAPFAGFYKNFNVLQELSKSAGLGEDSVERFLFSVNLSRVYANAESGQPPSFGDVDVLGAYVMKKPLAADAMQKFIPAAIKLFADGKPTPNVKTQDFSHGGVNGVSVNVDFAGIDFLPFPGEAPKLPPFAFVTLGDNKVIYMGYEKDVKAAIDRANAGTKTAFTPELKKLHDATLAGAPVTKHDGLLIWVAPKALRDFATTMGDQAVAGGMLPPGMQPALDAAKNFQGLRILMDVSDKATGALNLVVDTPERAKTLRDFLEINALGAAKMGLYQATGKNLPFAESLKAVADGDSVSINFTATVDDYATFLEIAKKQLEQSPFIIEEDLEIDE